MYDPKKCADDDDYPYPKLKKDEVQQLEDEPDLSETMLRYPLSGLDISGYLDLNLNDDLSKFGPSILSTDIFHPRALFIMAIEAALSLVRHRRRSFTWEAINERRSLRVDFLSLSHRQRWYQLSQPNADSHGHGQPVPPLTTEETERHQQIVRKISQADHNYWSSIAALQWREQVVFE